MLNKIIKLVFGILVIGLLTFVAFNSKGGVINFGGYTVNSYDTTSAGFTVSTSSVAVTVASSTQLFASVDKVSYVINNTTSTITCALEARNATMASSSVVAGRGVLIGSNAGTQIPSMVAFGNCDNVGVSCFRHTGSVNCIADVATVVDKLVQ